MKKKVKQYAITTGTCLVLSFLLLWSKGCFKSFEVDEFRWSTRLEKVYYLLADCTFIPGVLCVCVGLLIVCSNGGAYEMIVYGMKRFFSLFQKDINKIKYKTFYEYHIAKAEEPKQSFGYFLIVGSFFICLGILFTFLWSSLR